MQNAAQMRAKRVAGETFWSILKLFLLTFSISALSLGLSTCEVSVILTCVQTEEHSEHQYLSHITFQKLFEQWPDLYAFLVTVNGAYIQSADLEVKLSQQKHGKQLQPSDVDDFISLIGLHWFS